MFKILNNNKVQMLTSQSWLPWWMECESWGPGDSSNGVLGEDSERHRRRYWKGLGNLDSGVLCHSHLKKRCVVLVKGKWLLLKLGDRVGDSQGILQIP